MKSLREHRKLFEGVSGILPHSERYLEGMSTMEIVQGLDFDEIFHSSKILEYDPVLAGILIHISIESHRKMRRTLGIQGRSVIQLPELRLHTREEIYLLHGKRESGGKADTWQKVFKRNKEFRQIFNRNSLEQLEDYGLLVVVEGHTSKKRSWDMVFLTVKGWMVAAILIDDPFEICEEHRTVLMSPLDSLLDLDTLSYCPALIAGRDKIVEKFSKHLIHRLKVKGGGIVPILGELGVGVTSFLTLLRYYIQYQHHGKVDLQGIWIEIDSDVHQPNTRKILEEISDRGEFEELNDLTDLLKVLHEENRKVFIIFSNFDSYLTTRGDDTFLNEWIFRINEETQGNLLLFLELNDPSLLPQLTLERYLGETPLPAPALALQPISYFTLREFFSESLFRNNLKICKRASQPKIYLELMLKKAVKIIDSFDEYKEVTTYRKVYSLYRKIEEIRNELLQVNSLTWKLPFEGKGVSSSGLEFSFHQFFESISGNVSKDDVRDIISILEEKKRERRRAFFEKDSIPTLLNHFPTSKVLKREGKQIGFKHMLLQNEFIDWLQKKYISTKESELFSLVKNVELYIDLAKEIRNFKTFPRNMIEELERLQHKLILNISAEKKETMWEQKSEQFALMITVLALEGGEIQEILLRRADIDLGAPLRQIYDAVLNSEFSSERILKEYSLNLLSAIKGSSILQKSTPGSALYFSHIPDQMALEIFPRLLEQGWNIGTIDEAFTFGSYIADILITRGHELSFHGGKSNLNIFLALGERMAEYLERRYDGGRFAWYRAVTKLMKEGRVSLPISSIVSPLMFEPREGRQELFETLTDGLNFQHSVQHIITDWQILKINFEKTPLRGTPISWLLSVIEVVDPANFHSIDEYLWSLIAQNMTTEITEDDVIQIDFADLDRDMILHAESWKEDLNNITSLYAMAWLRAAGFSYSQLSSMKIHDREFIDFLVEEYRINVTVPEPLKRRRSYLIEETLLEGIVSELCTMNIEQRDKVYRRILNNFDFSSSAPRSLFTLLLPDSNPRDAVIILNEWVDTSIPDEMGAFILIVKTTKLFNLLLHSNTLHQELVDFLGGKRTTKVLLHNLSVLWRYVRERYNAEMIRQTIKNTSPNLRWVDLIFLCSIYDSIKSVKEYHTYTAEIIGEDLASSILEFVITMKKTSSTQIKKLVEQALPPIGINEAFLATLVGELFFRREGMDALVRTNLKIIQRWITMFDRTCSPREGIPALAVPYSYAALRTYLKSVIKKKERPRSLINAIFILNHALTSWYFDFPTQFLFQEKFHNMLTTVGFDFQKYMIYHRLEIISVIENSLEVEDAVDLAKLIINHKDFAVDLFGFIVPVLYSKFEDETTIDLLNKHYSLRHISLI